ncbi:hypothetical protein OESDEN_24001 [Oesophagostomum dentatum]|uniref:Protein Wnt n=1 Tax=Oesophagostomum dentatum TaxID=61180 RepID=A0A0B1RUL2_OESDE|nr:hypothetical protein OESDEN_24001 [Oesophagostomum dentatum]
MSGSCEIKTCWDTLPSFREIGMIIKDKFDGASEVAIEEEDSQPRIVMKNSQFKRHTNADFGKSAQILSYLPLLNLLF